jgi:membrane associated rhomboid family serine protease
MFIPYKIEEERIYPSWPWVVYTIMAVCIGVHFYLYDHLSNFDRENIFFNFGCVPVDFKWWTSFTCTLLHGSALHLLGNLYFLWIYGRTCEKALGIWKFILLYLIGAFVSVMAHVWTVPWLYCDVPTIGASGAISAVLGAFLVMFPKLKIRFLVLAFGRPLPSEGPAYFVLGSWFFIQLLYSLQIIGDSMSVAFWAHVAGFAAGALVGSIFIWLDAKSREEPVISNREELLPAWQAFCSGEDPTPYLPANSYADLPFAAPKLDPDSSLLSAVMTMDRQAAFQALVTGFWAARTELDYPRMFFYYYRLLRLYTADDIPENIHFHGAIAASRVDAIAIAAFGFRQAALSGTVESTERLLQGTITILEKLGESDRAAALSARIMPRSS